jgi:hypothetical protein
VRNLHVFLLFLFLFLLLVLVLVLVVIGLYLIGFIRIFSGAVLVIEGNVARLLVGDVLNGSCRLTGQLKRARKTRSTRRIHLRGMLERNGEERLSSLENSLAVGGIHLRRLRLISRE